jgi:hypothetical protein
MIFGLVFGGVGFLLMALALIFLVRTRIFISNSQQAQATITQMVYSSDSEGGGGYTPVFRFRTLQGQEVEVSGGLRTNPPQFKVGQTIDVLYDPDKPQKARIKKWFNLYFVPALLGFLGLVFGCGGIGSMIAAWFGVF